MPRVKVTPGRRLDAMAKNLADPTAILRAVGVLMVAESQRAFKDQRFGSKTWDARAPVNVFGIIADFAAGKKTPPSRRFETRPALRDTGRLASSIAFAVTSATTVEVGTTVDYAAVHQTGGKVESKPITDQVRDLLGKWLRTQPLPIKRALGWLLNEKFKGRTVTRRVPARPFLGITPQTREVVKRAVGARVTLQ